MNRFPPLRGVFALDKLNRGKHSDRIRTITSRIRVPGTLNIRRVPRRFGEI